VRVVVSTSGEQICFWKKNWGGKLCTLWDGVILVLSVRVRRFRVQNEYKKMLITRSRTLVRSLNLTLKCMIRHDVAIVVHVINSRSTLPRLLIAPERATSSSSMPPLEPILPPTLLPAEAIAFVLLLHITSASSTSWKLPI
jgi:hypothetical protein